MADLVIVANNVIAGDKAIRTSGFAGEAVTAGQCVYLDPVSRTWLKANSASATTVARTAGGIALNSAVAGQPVSVQTGGEIALGSVLTPGVVYMLSNAAGGICTDAGLAAGAYVCLLGIARTASVLALGINAVPVIR